MAEVVQDAQGWLEPLLREAKVTCRGGLASRRPGVLDQATKPPWLWPCAF